MTGTGYFSGVDNGQGVLCSLPARSLSDHPLRTGFYDQTHMEGLVASIKANGLWEPVLVRPYGDSQGNYQILSGHYRVRAVRRLRRPTILCRVVVCDDHTAKLVFCTARILTRGLSAMEEALILRELVNGDGMTMAGSGALFGRSKSWVSRRLKLLSALEPLVLAEVGHGLFQPRLAQELYRLPRGNGDQERVLSLARKYHLNKEELRELVDQWLEADEAGKSRLAMIFQKPGIRKGCRRGIPTSEAQLKRYAVEQLRQCVLLLDQLVEVAATALLPAVEWWPAPAYKILLQTVGKLDAVVDPAGHALVGGDWSLAPLAHRTAGKEAFQNPYRPGSCGSRPAHPVQGN